MSVERSAACSALLVAAALLFLPACDSAGSESPRIADDLQGAGKPSMVQVTDQPIGEDELQALGIADAVSHSLRFTDSHGEYAVVFSRRATHGEDPADGVVVDRIVLSAIVQQLPASQEGKEGRWQHSGEVECDGVDIEAHFYPETFSVTDLDRNGTAELTFAYYRFCGGGIDPRDVTVVLKEGGSAYVLEGQSLVKVGDDPAFGGEFEMEAALAKAPIWLQKKVLTTWEQVRDGQTPDSAP